MRHGVKVPSMQTYKKGCRCEECTEFGEQYKAMRRERDRKRRERYRQERLEGRVEVHTHGAGGYQKGCRCYVCREAMTDHRRTYKDSEEVDWAEGAHLIPGAGVRRRKG